MSGIDREGEKYAASSGSSETSDILDSKDDEGWEDAEPDQEEIPFISLLDDEVFMDIQSMLSHCKEKYGFDFLEVRQRLGLDFYDNIKLVNYIRSRVHSGHKITSSISREDFDNEKYLKPVLESDALLFSLDELPDVENVQSTDKGKAVEAEPGALVARVSELEEELRRMQSQFDNYRATVSETLDERWNERSPSGPSKPIGEEKEGKRDDDSHYFSSYSYNGTNHSAVVVNDTDTYRYS
jgi:protein arginine N-methyltransferase 3